MLVKRTGVRGLPLQADSGDSGRAESSGYRAGVYTPAMLAIPEQSPFWGFALLGTAGKKENCQDFRKAEALRQFLDCFCVIYP